MDRVTGPKKGGKMNEKEMVGVKEAAEIIGVSGKTIREWVKKGVLPHYRLVRRIKFDRSELEKLKHGHRVEAKPAKKETK